MSALADRMTLGESLNAVRDTLARAGTPNPLVNAERMLEDLLALSRTGLYLGRDQAISESQRAQLEKWTDERCSGKPLQYLLGHSGFFGLDLEVEEGVFIPRPETEVLVEKVIRCFIGSRITGQGLRFLDIGTGSGAIAVALTANFASAHGVAVDCSEPALRLAKRNAVRCGVQSRIRFEKCDLFPSSGESFDLILSNPPYLPSHGIQNLAWEVKAFEPRSALDGGDDGMRIHRAIIDRSREILSPDGLLALEVGIGQAQAVAGMMLEVGYHGVAIEKDLAGIDRVVIGKQSSYMDKAING